MTRLLGCEASAKPRWFPWPAPGKLAASAGVDAPRRFVCPAHSTPRVHDAPSRPLALRRIVGFEPDGDEIRRSVAYYDVATILGQLGILEIGDESAAAAPAP
jgi:hypothetical protein